MAIEKTLLLKGLAGVAAIGGVGGGVVIAHKNGAFKSKKEREAEAKKKESVNSKLTTLGLADCKLEDGDVKSSTTFSKECELTKEQFQKINFSNKGSTDVTVAGWTEGTNNKIKLKIENKPGDENGIKFLFKDHPSNLTVSGTTGDQTKFSIRTNKETEFEDKNNKLSKKVDTALSAKQKGYNTKLGTLEIPDDCRFDETESDTSLECSISKEQLKKIKFWNKGTGDLTITPDEDFSSLKLAIDKKEGGDEFKYVFKGADKKIVLSGDNSKSITLKKDVENEFEFKEEVLRRPRKIDELAKLVKLKCTYEENSKGNSGSCTLEEDGNQISVSSDGSTSYTISFSSGSTNENKKSQVRFDFTEYEYDYDNEVKFTYKGETLTENSAKLENNANYGIKTINKGATYWFVKKTT